MNAIQQLRKRIATSTQAELIAARSAAADRMRRSRNRAERWMARQAINRINAELDARGEVAVLQAAS